MKTSTANPMSFRPTESNRRDIPEMLGALKWSRNQLINRALTCYKRGFKKRVKAQSTKPAATL